MTLAVYGSTQPDAELVVLYGNCQIPYVAALLSQADAVPGQRGYACVLNHAPPGHAIAGPSAAQMRRCRVYLEQYDSADDPPLRAQVRAMLPAGCPTLVFPPLWMTCFWPFSVPEPAARRIVEPDFPYGRFPFGGDRIGLAVARAGLAGAAAFDAYLRLSDQEMPDLRRRLDRDLAAVDRRDRASDVTIGDYVRDHFRTRHLFWWTGHVALDVLGALAARLAHAAAPVLGTVTPAGLQRLDATLATLPPMGNLQLPIDPRVAAALELAFCEPDMRFDWAGERWTFRDYMIRYIAGGRA